MSLMRRFLPIALLTLFNFSFLTFISAQRSIEGVPISFSPKYADIFASDTEAVQVPALNMNRIKAEDKQSPSNRFAAPVAVDFNTKDHGTWYDLEDGGRVWKLKLKADGALGLFIFYKNFYLPNGARLYVYDENKQKVLGAYSNLNNSPSGKFMTGMIEGTTAIIEYYEPWYAKRQGRLEINQIMQAYDREKMESDYEFQVHTGFGQSLPCHENINCTAAANLQDQKRGVVRIMTIFNTGLGWCSGSLINTTENDGSPYILTANHCGFLGNNIADFAMWRFDFNYEFPTCTSTSTEPIFQSLLGCEVLSGQQISDFLLLKLSSNIPSSYNAYFNGWNRQVAVPDSAHLIHHPFGDVKKISIDTQTLESYPHIINWNDSVVTPPHSHFRSLLDLGTIEGGSSGAPCFDVNGNIVGQLHGGVANCNTMIIYHGKFSTSWAEGQDSTSRLDYWLDPNETGTLNVGGIENPLLLNGANVFGKIAKENGTPVTGVEMQVTGPGSTNSTNANDGKFEIVDLEIGNSFTVKPFRNDNHKNGVNTIDMLLMRQHILNIGAPLSPYQIIAGDVNRDGDLNTFDMLLVKKIILEWDQEFANNTSWRFIPADYVFADPTNPFNEPFPEMHLYDPLLATMNDQDYIAIKVGDLNNTAN
ncbi:MAG: dockerin type I domain-containing protein [Bacteroidota bacterium]